MGPHGMEEGYRECRPLYRTVIICSSARLSQGQGASYDT